MYPQMHKALSRDQHPPFPLSNPTTAYLSLFPQTRSLVLMSYASPVHELNRQKYIGLGQQDAPGV